MFQEVKKEKNVFCIAEVGQNHQGSLDRAREYIRIFAFEGANAVKFQTRNNRYLFSDEAYCAKYGSENAFAETYGEHREALELNPEWLPILKKDCEEHKVKFMSTPFDEPSLELLLDVGVEILKIASFDLGNLPLINNIAKANKPVVISVGGGNFDQIMASVDILLSYGVDLAVLHCVSEYPCEYNKLGLRNIKQLTEAFPDATVGLSDHFNGTLSGPIAYMMGAFVFEKHVTLNRSWKGTDHSFALEPEGFRKFVRDIKRVKHMLPPKPDSQLGKEFVFQKLGKSITAKIDLKAGDKLTLDNMSGKIFPKTFIPVRESENFLGKSLKYEKKCGEPIVYSDLG